MTTLASTTITTTTTTTTTTTILVIEFRIYGIFYRSYLNRPSLTFLHWKTSRSRRKLLARCRPSPPPPLPSSFFSLSLISLSFLFTSCFFRCLLFYLFDPFSSSPLFPIFLALAYLSNYLSSKVSSFHYSFLFPPFSPIFLPLTLPLLHSYSPPHEYSIRTRSSEPLVATCCF